MRLWHTDLIPVLPRQQLLGQWRELNSIYRKQDKHILINFIYECPNTFNDLYSYSLLIMDEMEKRGYRYNDKNFEEYFLCNTNSLELNIISNIYPRKMTKRYLKQCLYNLQEKYDCGGITQEEWLKIYQRFGYLLEY